MTDLECILTFAFLVLCAFAIVKPWLHRGICSEYHPRGMKKFHPEPGRKYTRRELFDLGVGMAEYAVQIDYQQSGYIDDHEVWVDGKDLVPLARDEFPTRDIGYGIVTCYPAKEHK
jgi:hypothetical protein